MEEKTRRDNFKSDDWPETATTTTIGMSESSYSYEERIKRRIGSGIKLKMETA